MNQSFDATSTTDEVLAGVDLRDKRVLVTGVSSGLGVETARVLAAHGAQVVGAARDLRKAEAALADVGAQRVSLEQLDLASLASVRACADRLRGLGEPFHLVIANAGVMAPPFGLTVDGFELQFGTNHLGHFVLVNRIAPLMPDGARLVNLSSAGHRRADVDLADPNFEHTPYDPWVGYGRAKTANILFAVEFDRRHRDRGVRATAVHPGGIRTELSRHLEPAALDQLIASLDAELAAQGLPPYRLKSIAQGAATTVWAGVVAPADEVGGRYCEDCHVTSLVTDGPITVASGGVRPYALDPGNARALWDRSEELVGERF